MNSKKVLLVDDDALLRQSLAFNLKKAGYQVATASSAEEGLELVKTKSPDLILLDVGLPGMDGLDAIKRIRAGWSIPVIFLTGRRKELDEILGLELGADDYITKPFELDVLLAHIKAVLRRTQQPSAVNIPAGKATAGDIIIDPAAHAVTHKGNPVALSPREFDLLSVLVLNAGRVVSTEELISKVWGEDFIGQPQVVYVHIRWLREKIEDDPKNPHRILTVHGIGYKFQVLEP
jgi:DNA-binding response OmpR family regulator